MSIYTSVFPIVFLYGATIMNDVYKLCKRRRCSSNSSMGMLNMDPLCILPF